MRGAAEDREFLGLGGLDRKAEIDDSYIEIMVNHDVFEFDIPVDDPLLVAILNPGNDLSENDSGVFFWESFVLVHLDGLLQRFDSYELHHEVDMFRRFDDFEEFYDIRVVELF